MKFLYAKRFGNWNTFVVWLRETLEKVEAAKERKSKNIKIY